jgi:hypothetical protein
MQPYASIGAEPNDVAGVRGDFRLKENNLEHEEGSVTWPHHLLRRRSKET